MTTKPDELDIPDYDPTPYVVTNPAPNPYDDPAFDGKQAEPGPQQEGLGGDALPESPSTYKQALYWLHQLAAANATVQPDGEPIHEYCLSVQHNASRIGPLHYDAKSDALDNPDYHHVTYDTVDWSKVPDGSFVYWQVGLHWHIARKTTHNGRVLIVSSDVRPSMIGYCDPLWFQTNWGAELDGYSSVCNQVWQKGIPGNDPKPPPKKPPVHKNLEESRPNVARAHTLIEAALKDNADNPEFVAEFTPVADALGVAFRKIYAKTK